MSTSADASSSRESSASPTIPRRTLLVGAAWAVPAVTLTATTPAFAASGDLAVAFDKASYTGNPCSTISGAYVTATRGSVPEAGQAVSVSLSAGYTFSNGATTYTGTTGTNGRISLPDMNVPAQGGTGTASAVSGSAPASATLTAVVPPGTHKWSQAGANATNDYAVPTGSTALGDSLFLTPNGDLYWFSTKLAGDVTSAAFNFAKDNTARITYVNGSGCHKYSQADGKTFDYPYPTNSTAVGDSVFVTPSGDLYWGDTKLATGVTSANGELANDSTARITYVNASGGHKFSQADNATFDYSVPTGSTAIGDSVFITPSGDLYWTAAPSGSMKLASGVTSAAFNFAKDNTARITYVNGSGCHKYSQADSKTFDCPYPANSTAVGDSVFVTPSGDLYWGDTKLATGVTSANGELTNDNTARITYVNSSGGHKLAQANFVTDDYSYPAGSTPVGDSTFVTPSGDLYWFNTKLAIGVTSANGELANDSTARITYVNASGGHKFSQADNATFDYSVPAGSTAVGDSLFLTPAGDLYWGTTKLAGGVTSAAFNFAKDNTARITYVNGSGCHKYSQADAKTFDYPYPANSTAVGDSVFVTPSGDLYWGDTKLATGVTSANGELTNDNTARITYVNSGGCHKWSQTNNTTSDYPWSKNSTAVGDSTFLTASGDLYWFDIAVGAGVGSAVFNFAKDNTARITYSNKAPNC